MKIILIGSSGAGKSVLARRLEEKTGFPVLHLDKIWHTMDGSELAREKFRAQQRRFLLENENAIIDGNYAGTLDERLPHADEIVWLKISRTKAVFRALKRSLSNRLFHNRSDMPTGWTEKWDQEFFEFLNYIWHFPQEQFPKMKTALDAAEVWDKVVILKNHKEIEKYLTQYEEKD